jgi:predicted phage terminase large subunit-like protein
LLRLSFECAYEHGDHADFFDFIWTEDNYWGDAHNSIFYKMIDPITKFISDVFIIFLRRFYYFRRRLPSLFSSVWIQSPWFQERRIPGMAGRDDLIEFPAILPSGNPLWPEFWSKEELEALHEELPNAKWQAQYQQNPVGNESAIIKRDWWKIWPHERAPKCDYVLQTWDTAFEKTQRADYSAGTTWGIFNCEEDDMRPNIILLNTYRKRVEWVDLKKDVLNEYNEWEPDGMLIEKKATGGPLIYELRAMGIPVQEFTPGKGQDKIARLNAVSDIIASGKVWVPDTRWAEELVDEIGAFPSGEHDDLVDATTLALMRFRQGGFLRLPSDELDEVRLFKSGRRAAYY